MRFLLQYRSLPALFPLVMPFTAILAQTCYFTDESIAEGFTPCNSTASATTCCQRGEACLTSGLCYLGDDVSINAGACTDKTWRDTNCFQGCDLSPTSDFNTLYRCNNNDWCCSLGGNITSCCASVSSDYLFSINGTGNFNQIYNGSAWAPGYTLVPISALATDETNGTTLEAGPTVTATISSSGTPYSDGNEAIMVSLGVGVGVGVGVPLLAALTGVWVLLVKEKRKTRLLQANGAGRSSERYGYPKGDAGHGREPQWQEMSAIPPVRELAEGSGYAELR